MTANPNSPIILVRPEQPAMYDAIGDVHRAAFGRANEAELVAMLRQSPDFDSRYALMALFDGQVVGHILFSRVWIEGHARLRGLGLGPIAVLPDYQNQGVGSALIYEGLEICRRTGIDYIVVLGDSSYYPRFGFTTAADKNLRSEFDAPREAFMVIELKSGVLDNVSGVVHYPDAYGSV